MPIRDYRCQQCKHIVSNTFEELEKCPECEGPVAIYWGDWSVTLDIKSDKEYRAKRERFRKRNKRFEKMTEKQQNGFKHIIKSTGGKMYLP